MTNMNCGIVKILISDQTSALIKKFNLILNVPEHHKNWNFVEKKELISFLHETQDDILQDLKRELSVCQLDLLFVHHEIESTTLVFCLTEDATEEMIKQVGLYDQDEYQALKITCHRTPRCWQNLGSDNEIIESKALNQRALRTVEAIVPIQPGKKQQYLQTISKKKQEVSCSFFPSVQVQTDLLHRRTIDVNLQSCSVKDAKIQTTLNLPNSMWTLWEPQLKSEENLTSEETQGLKLFLGINVQQVLREVHYNSMPNLYQNCYQNLCESEETGFQEDFSYKIHHYISQKEDVTAMSCYSWHPKSEDVVIIAYRADVKYCVSNVEFDETEANNSVPDTNRAHIWDCRLKKQMSYLESPCELSSISFCPYNPRLIVGGCVNGQIVLWDTIQDLIVSHKQRGVKKADDIEIVRIAPTVVSPFFHKKEISGIHWLPRKIKVNKSGATRNDEIPSVQVMSLSEDGYICVWDFLDLPTTQGETDSKRIDTSPFTTLHKNIQPVFKLSMHGSAYRSVITASCVMSTTAEALVQEKNEIIFPAANKLVPAYDEGTNGIVSSDLTVFVGTIEGAVSLINISAGLEITEEQDTVPEIKIKNSSIFHDGPVLCILQSPLDCNLVLSIGGHTFAVWKQNVHRHPLYLKESKHYLSSGAWSLYKQRLFYIFGENGTLQVWDFLNDKCEMLSQHCLCPGPLKALPYELKTQRNQYLPFCDSQAALYFCKIPQGHIKIDVNECVKVRDRFSKEARLPRPSSGITSKGVKGWLTEDKVKTMLKEYRSEEERFLLSEREARREHTEVQQLTEQLAHWDVGVRKETRRKLELINELPKTLLTLKNIDKQVLLKAHQPVVQLDNQQLKKKLLYNKRVDQCLNDIHKQQKTFFQQKADLAPPKAGDKIQLYKSTQDYFQQFRQQEEEIVTHFG